MSLLINFVLFLVLNYAYCRILVKKQLGPPGGQTTTFNFAESQVNANTDPLVTSWTKATIYSPYVPTAVADINKIQYSSKFVYVSCSSLPSYNIGPWKNNPNKALDQKFSFKFPRVPAVNVGTKRAVGAGNIGILKNGIGLFSAGDGMSYNSLGVWRQNAYFFEQAGFDGCNGHPQKTGLYHVHLTPICLFSLTDSTKHSPLLGFAFDGFPIYGPFGCSLASDSGSPIKRVSSSYRTRSISKRTNLPNGTELVLTKYGPDVSTSYPLGSFIEDYEFVEGLGDLDMYNGRFSVTPEYPGGIYAYYVTIDANGAPAYPYSLGPNYYGQVVLENFGGNGSPNEAVTTFFQF